jgi:colicin import membrane protein
MEEAAKEQASLQKQVEDSLSATTKAKQALDAANVQLAAAQHRVDALKAAQFNVQVWAAKRELAKVQAELDALGAKGEDARRAAADAEAKAKAGELAVPAAQAAIKKAQEALAQAKAAPAKAEAASRPPASCRRSAKAGSRSPTTWPTAARGRGQEGAGRRHRGRSGQEGQGDPGRAPEERGGGQERPCAARRADLEKAKAAIPAAEKAIVDAKAAADQAAEEGGRAERAAARRPPRRSAPSRPRRGLPPQGRGRQGQGRGPESRVPEAQADA